ncbi:MAG: hypothetical protein QF570_17790 [Myxococcota bacterium]|nr:hypothetical protein [Myxococcota bacterium]
MSKRTLTASKHLIVQLALLIFAYTLIAPASLALETTVDERKLGGHTFMSSMLISQPFMTRSYAMTTGVGFTEFDVGEDDTLDFASFGLEANFQQPLTENIGVTFDLLGAVIAATGEDAALQLAANGIWNLGGGAVWNFMEGDSYSVSLRWDFGGGQGYTASPLVAIQEALRQGDVTADGLLVRAKNFDMTPAINAAYGINEWIGVYGATGYTLDYTNPSVGSSDDFHTFELGFGASIDLNATNIPVGLVLGYQLEQEMNKDPETANYLEFGIRYAPNEHFNLGFSILGDFAEVDKDTDRQAWSGTLGIVYYQ